MERAEIRSGWAARPPALRLFVGAMLVATVVSLVRDPSALSFPAILFTAVFLAFLKKLWDGSAETWWLFVILSAAGIAAALAAVRDDPAGWGGVAIGAVSLVLLVSGSTRSWVEQEGHGRAP